MLRVKKYNAIIFIGFMLHLFVAFWNGFFGPSIGAELDAQGLFSFAVDVSERLNFRSFTIGYVPYINTLGLIFYFTTPSLFLGSFISCLFWLASAIIFMRILHLCGISDKNKYYASLVYALLPSSILFTSVTLREPFQLFFMTLSVYTALSIWLKGGVYKFIPLIIYIICGGILHGALLIAGLVIFCLTIALYFMRTRRNVSFLKILIGFSLALPIFFIGLTYSFLVSYDLDGGNLATAAQSYQSGALDVGGRADYKTYTNFTGIFSIFNFLIFGFIQYLFEPFPWNIRSAFDLAVAMEGGLRFILMYMFVKNIISSSGRDRKTIIFLAICFLANEVLWSLGTVNWGTAARHHIPSIGILLAGAFYSPKSIFAKFNFKG
ncbi:hypothetical protein N9R46_00525 [Gammaproteobacteria bacterium]|nr:hypothetical protein [Gammaproteobacteria bacterium]